MDIQAEISDLFEDNGRYINQRPVAAERIQQYRGKLPEFLLEIWRLHGLGSWAKGLYNLCDPDDFKGLLSQVFHADADLSHQDCHVFAYSAFGELAVWSERHGTVGVALLTARVDCPGLADPAAKGDPDIRMVNALSLYAEALQALDVSDEDGKPLFARAVKKLGTPEPGQAFGFFPAPAAGGAQDLDHLRLTPALEYFLFLAQLQRFSLVDYLSSPPRIIRMIG